MSKEVIVFAIKMTRLEEMKFSKFRNSREVQAFNTITAPERTEITHKWLIENRRYNASSGSKPLDA